MRNIVFYGCGSKSVDREADKQECRHSVMADGFDKLFEARDKMTPEAGYNLVGIDYSKDIGDELYLISHHDTYEQAVAAKKSRGGEHTVIYPDRRSKE